MATPISHIVYAEKFLKSTRLIGNSDEFYLGVAFPDIRQISNVTRGQTHNKFESLDLDFTNLTDFEAGWKFHVWCDLRRNEILRDEGLFEIKDVQQGFYMSNYFVEDFLLWPKFKKWPLIGNLFKSPPYIQHFKELNNSDWDYWYNVLSNYVNSLPNQSSIEKYCMAIPSLGIRTPAIIDEMEKLMKNDKVVNSLRMVYEEILKK